MSTNAFAPRTSVCNKSAFFSGLLLLLAAASVGAVGGGPRPACAQQLEPASLPLGDLSAFASPQDHWQIVGGAWAPRTERRVLRTRPGTGVLVAQPTEDTKGRAANLFTKWKHGDLFLEMDVMMPKGSNSGIYLMSRYEVQLLDSWGVREPTSHDMGALYQRWDERRPEGRKGYQGHPPRLNVARAPGLWQHLEIAFEAPRFDAQGRKTRNARFKEVRLNGVVVQENLEVTGPTRGPFTDEVAEAPLMIQGNHGPVALRNIRYKRYGAERVRLSGLEYRYSDAGPFDGMPALDTLAVTEAGPTDVLTQQVASDDNTFALEVTGALQIPTAGDYRFTLTSSGLSRLTVGSEETGGAEEGGGGRIRLSAGRHPFTLVYVKASRWGPPSLSLFAEGPGMPRQELTAPRSALSEEESVDPILVGAGARPYVLRSFLWRNGYDENALRDEAPARSKKLVHAASVGDPSGTHYAVDLARGALLRVWKGGFVDATPMWHQRGNAQVALPRGSVIALPDAPPVAALADTASAPWPDSLSAFRYRGYRLGEDNTPTFRYDAAGLQVEDHLRPEEDGRVLARTMTLRRLPDAASAGAAGERRRFVRLAAADQIERLPDGSYAVGDFAFYVDAVQTSGPPLLLRTAPGGGQELLLPVALGMEEAAQISYRLIW